MAKTCHDLALCGFNESGEYELNPWFGEEPIRVFCDFNTNSTVIRPESGVNEFSLQNCDSSECASVNVSYGGASMDQIKLMMASSAYCQQEIEFSCNLAPLVLDGESFASWVDGNGIKQSFTQDNDRHVQCKCGNF